MSKTLYLLRHGRAEDAQGGGVDADFQRSLSAQGVAEIRRLAQRLKQQDFAPARVLVSAAARTRQTAELLELPTPSLRDDYYLSLIHI